MTEWLQLYVDLGKIIKLSEYQIYSGAKAVGLNVM